MPCAQNTHELKSRRRNQEDELGVFFWKLAAKALEKERLERTTQGLYAFSAAGDLYFFNNNRDPKKLARLLEKAKADFDAKPPAKLEKLEPRRSDPAFTKPSGAKVARVFTRISPLPEGLAQDDLNRSVGRDALWILRVEAEELAKGRFPKTLAARIARFHLLDDVRGEPDFWKPEEVERASFELEAADSDKGPRFKVSGSFRMRAPGNKREDGKETGERGFEGVLEGELVCPGGELSSIKLLARGKAWGESTYTGGAPEGKFPLSVAIVFPDPDETKPLVPPQGVIAGRDEYLSPKLRDE